MNVLEGKLIAEGLRFGIVVGRFNEFIGSKLLGGCVDGLVRHGVEENDIDVAWVPGAFEIPVIAKKLAESGKYDAVICLGAGYVRSIDYGYYTAGCRKSRYKVRKQGLRLCLGSY